MKKEFSFYEFTGVLVPSVILLYFSGVLLKENVDYSIFDYSSIGEVFIFLTIAYGIGHLLHGLGNFLERILWWFLGGKPTNWISKKPNFGLKLFDDDEQSGLLEKIQENFGEKEGKDYGMLVYSKIYSEGLTNRADIFNANYSMFRGLSVACLLLLIFSLIFQSWVYSSIIGIFTFLGIYRMIRFGRHYAKEVYRVYYAKF